MFTSQHYCAIADVLATFEGPTEAAARVSAQAQGQRHYRRQLAMGLADMFKQDNDRFDTVSFLTRAKV